MVVRGARRISLLLALLPAIASAGEQSMRADARLGGVCFVDVRQGWVVGDRGVIRHTDDGGKTWQPQNSGVSCRLESVCFIDHRTGWAAGGFCHPYTHAGSGVLLSTRDGGKHWHRHDKLLLPLIKQIGFLNAKQGWAIGCSSAMFPSGALVTDDGGRGWSPLLGGAGGGWQAAGFLNLLTGALAGRGGTVAASRRGAIEPASAGGLGLRTLRRLELVAPLYGWMIGDGGLVMTTADLGVTWQTPPAELDRSIARHFDFAAMAVRGPKVWIAGTPGSRVFFTPDAGRCWTAFATGQSLPIQDITFADDRHGCAVGALGTILMTDDGGQSWRRVGSGGSRAALLGLFARAENVPLELFARLSGDEGYLGVVEVLGRSDVEPASRKSTHPADRLHEALVGVGASQAETAWRFPLRQPGLRLGEEKIVDNWNRANDGRAMVELEAHLVRQIRIWRPELIVTDNADVRGDRPLERLMNRAVLQAVRQAADPMRQADQISRAGLEPWKVKKVYVSLGPGQRGRTEIATAQLATRLGRSLADVAAGPRGLLQDRFAVGPKTLGFNLMLNELSKQGERDFFSGIILQPGGEARRRVDETVAENVEVLRRAAQKRRNTRAILEQAKDEPKAGTNLLAQTGELTRGLDSDGAAAVLFHLGWQYHESGKWSMAAETFHLLTDRYPLHPLAQPAWMWLLQYYASSETAWRLQGRQRFTVKQASALSIDLSQQENRTERALQLAGQIERTHPELFAEPAIGFPLAAMNRRHGRIQQAERFYLGRRRNPAEDAWMDCARGEQWLAKPVNKSPKPLLHCALAPSKPHLDGKLDDPVWKFARPVPLASARHDDADWPAEVMLAYDANFLYVALRVTRAPGAKYQPTPGPRPRDPDLSNNDRVDLLLDLDRDHATYYRLSIDHRGWTGEACWGDRTWNPNWFVAASSDDSAWIAEAAIPLDQLTGQYPTSRQVWAIGIQRTIPGVGFQSFSAPASTAIMPEGFGYLIFD